MSGFVTLPYLLAVGGVRLYGLNSYNLNDYVSIKKVHAQTRKEVYGPDMWKHRAINHKHRAAKTELELVESGAWGTVLTPSMPKNYFSEIQ